MDKPLNIREVNFHAIIGNPQNTVNDNTVIGLLKKILTLFE